MGNQSSRRDVAETDVYDLPPSAKLVFKLLEYDGEMTQKELVDETMLSARTVRFALEKLTEAEIVTSRINVSDARQRIYKLSSEYQRDTAAEKSESD